MARWLPLRAALVVVALLALAAPAPLSARADDVRGLWVLRASLSSPRSVQQMVDTAARGGFNTLLVQVRGRGDAYYDARVDPRAVELDDQPGAFDPLAATLTAAHAAGLKVHAWINVNLVSSAATLPVSRAHVIARHPEWVMVPRALAQPLRLTTPEMPAYVGQIARWSRAAADRVEGLYLSPIPSGARDYTASVVADIVGRYAVDGVHLDDLRYPTDDFDYSDAAMDAFRAALAPALTNADRQALDTEAARSATAWPDAFPQAWADFRRAKLTELMTQVRRVILMARPGLPVTAAVAPDPVEARAVRLQDWRAWAAAGLLDAVCPMAYSTDATVFTDAVARAKAAAGAVPVWAGIGAYRLTPSATATHVRAARRAGASGVLLFSYESLTAADAPPNVFAMLRPALLDGDGRR